VSEMVKEGLVIISPARVVRDAHLADQSSFSSSKSGVKQ
jgi:hypothetical protein